jgi:uncharacterized OB-fold protein
MISFEKAESDYYKGFAPYDEDTYICSSCGATNEDNGCDCSECGYNNYEEDLQ